MRGKFVIKKTLIVCINLVIFLFLANHLFLIRSLNAKDNPAVISVNPKEQFELSPYLYMQFMEPLGTTDGSVDAAWDFIQDKWREDVIDITKELAPTLMR